MNFRVLHFCFLAALCVSVVNAFSLDREAFVFADYDLNVQMEAEQHRLAVRGKITLRNDSSRPQKTAILQISSSLDWRSVKAGEKPLQFVSQIYTSDIDHTGALSEAIVSLPQVVVPKGTLELEVAYEGVVPLDTTRLTRIGTPEAAASTTDWDQISSKFTAVRGAGYVAWYPIATEAANLSSGNSMFDALGRWKRREADSQMQLQVNALSESAGAPPEIILNTTGCRRIPPPEGQGQPVGVECAFQPLGQTIPAFVVASYSLLNRGIVSIHCLTEHKSAAASYAEATDKVLPLIISWFGPPRAKAEVVELPDSAAVPFESGNLLLTPLGDDLKLAQISLTHALTHAAFTSPRSWIHEGLAHFMQALYLEQTGGRQAALAYMGLHRSAFLEADRPDFAPQFEDATDHSLINTASEELYRGKAMYVWWMLRDMIGEPALKKALAGYHPEQDKEPSYLPRLIAAQTQRDLEWFFDDWVYRDRGLPNFRVASAFPRKMLTEGYMVTVTVENLGAAGAEVPVTVRFDGGEVTKRLEVRGKNKGVIRVEVPAVPREVIINDSSVPESDTTNDTLKIQADDSK
jgi:hypothetical protein